MQKNTNTFFFFCPVLPLCLCVWLAACLWLFVLLPLAEGSKKAKVIAILAETAHDLDAVTSGEVDVPKRLLRRETIARHVSRHTAPLATEICRTCETEAQRDVCAQRPPHGKPWLGLPLLKHISTQFYVS